MWSVILAAGPGTRIKEYNGGMPKPLTLVGGRRLISYSIDVLKHYGDILVVVGYKGDLIKREFGDGSQYGATVKYIENSDWLKGNGTSVMLALSYLVESGPVFLTMGDHVIHREIYGLLLERGLKENEACLIAVDPSDECDIAVATRVFVDGGSRITSICKGLTKYTHIDTGAHLVDPEEMLLTIGDIQDGPVSFNRLKRRLIPHGRLHGYEVPPGLWVDVNNGNDVIRAERLLDQYRGVFYGN